MAEHYFKRNKMKNTVKLKGRMKSYLQSSLYLGFLLAVVDILVYLLDYRAGLVLTAFLIFYFAIATSMMLYNKPVIMNELISLRPSTARFREGFCGIWNCRMRFWTMREKSYGRISHLSGLPIRRRGIASRSLPFSLQLRRTTFRGGIRRKTSSAGWNTRTAIMWRS